MNVKHGTCVLSAQVYLPVVDWAQNTNHLTNLPCLLTLKKRIQVFETKSLRKCLLASYLELKTNDWMRDKINFPVGPQESLLATVRRRKLAWVGLVICLISLSETILHGTLEGGRHSRRQRKCWMDNVKEWPPFPRQNCSRWPLAKKKKEKKKREVWNKIAADSPSCPLRRPIESLN